MKEVNFFDHNSKHLFHGDEIIVHAVPSKSVSDKIRYVKNRMEYDGVTIFTDTTMSEDVVLEVKSKYKLGWLMEQREVTGAKYVFWHIDELINRFDFIMTYDPEILKAYPEKTRFVPLAYSWIEPKSINIHPKSKNTSMIYSSKQTLDGHLLRHRIGDYYQSLSGTYLQFPGISLPQIDLFGTGQKEKDGSIFWGGGFENKAIGLADYRFSVCIENTSDTNYFTEKIIDCFLTGTVPIYWGCPNIGDFFDTRGIIHITSYEEAINSIETLTEDDYNRMMPYIVENFERAKFYRFHENSVYEHIKDLN